MTSKFESMKEANRITHRILEGAKQLILNADSITSFEVNQYATFVANRFGVLPAFLNYKGFPASMCISVNDAVCHGLPTENYKIKKGDLVSLDFGVKVDGYCADAAISFVNRKPSILPTSLSLKKLADLKLKCHLVDTTKEALDKAVEALQNSYPNCKISDITKVIDDYKDKYGIIYGYGGHSIGKDVHEEGIFIPNHFDTIHPDKSLKIGDYFTIEPMFAIGSGIVNTVVDKEDGMTIRTENGALSAHFEYSLTITSEGVIVLK